jgi:hypothetical protein
LYVASSFWTLCISTENNLGSEHNVYCFQSCTFRDKVGLSRRR